MSLSATWGMVIRDYDLCARGFRNVLIGASLAWFSGVFVGLLLWINPSQQGLGMFVCKKIYEQFLFIAHLLPILLWSEDGLYNASGKELYFGVTINSAQITSRGPPAGANILSTIIIAIFSGIGIALGQTSGISSALSGVALSASLLPPIVNSGTGAQRISFNYYMFYANHQG